MENELFSGIVATEVEGTVGNNSKNRNGESLVEAEKTVRLVNLGQAVKETIELSFGLTDIGSQTGTGEVQRIHEAEGSSTGGTTRG